MNDNRNMILAIVLSALVLFGWSAITNYYFPTPQPTTNQSAAANQVQASQIMRGQSPQIDTAAARTAARRDPAAAAAVVSRREPVRRHAWPADPPLASTATDVQGRRATCGTQATQVAGTLR